MELYRWCLSHKHYIQAVRCANLLLHCVHNPVFPLSERKKFTSKKVLSRVDEIETPKSDSISSCENDLSESTNVIAHDDFAYFIKDYYDDLLRLYEVCLQIHPSWAFQSKTSAIVHNDESKLIYVLPYASKHLGSSDLFGGPNNRVSAHIASKAAKYALIGLYKKTLLHVGSFLSFKIHNVAPNSIYSKLLKQLHFVSEGLASANRCFDDLSDTAGLGQNGSNSPPWYTADSESMGNEMFTAARIKSIFRSVMQLKSTAINEKDVHNNSFMKQIYEAGCKLLNLGFPIWAIVTLCFARDLKLLRELISKRPLCLVYRPSSTRKKMDANHVVTCSIHELFFKAHTRSMTAHLTTALSKILDSKESNVKYDAPPSIESSQTEEINLMKWSLCALVDMQHQSF